MGALKEYLAAGAGVAVAGRKIDLASTVLSLLYNWEMQRLHFTAGLSTALDGGFMLETGFQDLPQEGEAEEPWGVFVGVLKAAPLISAAGTSAVHSVEEAPPGAGDAVYQAGPALAGEYPLRAQAAKAKAAPAGAAREGEAQAGAARAEPARAGATPARGPAVY